MRAVLKLIASVVAGAMLTVVNVAPAAEVRRFMTNRQRVISALFMFGFGLILILTSSMVALIDLVIQFEKQGSPAWNGLLSALSVMFVLGIGVLIAARATLPRARDFAVQFSAVDLTASLTNLTKPILDHWIQAGQNLAKTAAQKDAPSNTTSQSRSNVSRSPDLPSKDRAGGDDFLSSSGTRAPELDFI